MPSVAAKRSKHAPAVLHKHQELQQKYHEHADDVHHLFQLASEQLLPTLADQLDLQQEGCARVAAFLQDDATLFRFYRRSRYQHQHALSLLEASLAWRIKTDLDLLSLASLHPLYVSPPRPNPPLFWSNSSFIDRFGRPCGVINLRSVERTQQNTLDELKEYIVVCIEVLRRYIAHLNLRSRHDKHGTGASTAAPDSQATVIQAVIAVDLAGSGMANLELELLPFLLDLLKNHFPGMVGAVYLLHYGWVHAGMWAVAKRVLPQQALARIFFPSHDELREHFDAARIPKMYGGDLDVEMDAASNDVLRKWGRPKRGSSSAYSSPVATPDVARSQQRGLSRNSSYESIYEVFYSAAGTPWASRPITPSHSGPPTPRGDQSPRASSGLRMTPSAASKLRRLQMTRGEPSARQRSASDLRVEDSAALGLTVNTAGLSPVATPYGGRSPAVRGRRGVEAKHVHFGSPGAGRSLSPVRRIGTSRSFALQSVEGDGDDQLPSESESEASGKDGAKPPASPSQTDQALGGASQGGLLSRWRKGRRLSSSSAAFQEAEKDHRDEAEKGNDDVEEHISTITYIDPGSPQLQVPLLGEPPIFRSAVPQHRFLSQRSRKYEGRAGHVSPYNATNPFFGYPAYVGAPSQTATSAGDDVHRFSLGAGSTPQHLHVRRRKRDLMRTLTYLFVLRLLAFHRGVRWKAIVAWKGISRTMSVAGEDATDGDRLWRLAEERNRARGALTKGELSQTKSWSWRSLQLKLLYVSVLVGLLRPSGLRCILAQISAVLSSLLPREGLVKGSLPLGQDVLRADESIEVRRVSIPSPSARPESRRATWTGLHVRERLGPKTSAGGNSGGRNSRSRSTPLALAGSALVLASLGVYLYTQYGKQGGKGDGGDEDDDSNRRNPDPSGGRSSTKAPGKNAKRSTMSLSLAPSFDRSEATSVDGLRVLLTALSPYYLVHLILPSRQLEGRHSHEEMEDTILSFVATLGDVASFDVRRVLEYSRNSGRWAIPRALACDCHFEILVQSSGAPEAPREDGASALVELDKVRRSSGFVVVSALCPEQGSGGENDAGIDTVFAGLRRQASERGGPSSQTDAPAGMRAYDCRDQGPQGWHTIAAQVQALRESWK